jgi:CheY-like chemotaxis protein
MAHDGPEALAVAGAFLPEIMFLDIGLPVMDGYEVARHVRDNPRLAQTFLVALTGYGQESDRDRSRRAGFDQHLVKPVSLESIDRLVAGHAGATAAAAPPQGA